MQAACVSFSHVGLHLFAGFLFCFNRLLRSSMLLPPPVQGLHCHKGEIEMKPCFAILLFFFVRVCFSQSCSLQPHNQRISTSSRCQACRLLRATAVAAGPNLHRIALTIFPCLCRFPCQNRQQYPCSQKKCPSAECFVAFFCMWCLCCLCLCVRFFCEILFFF